MKRPGPPLSVTVPPVGTANKRLKSPGFIEEGNQSPTHTHGIVQGVPIRIRGPDLIHHKLRQYAYTDAVIADVPVHPNTWYGVQLADGKHIKIRKSAFDVLNGEASAISAQPIRTVTPRRSSASKAGNQKPQETLKHEITYAGDYKYELEDNGSDDRSSPEEEEGSDYLPLESPKQEDDDSDDYMLQPQGGECPICCQRFQGGGVSCDSYHCSHGEVCNGCAAVCGHLYCKGRFCKDCMSICSHCHNPSFCRDHSDFPEHQCQSCDGRRCRYCAEETCPQLGGQGAPVRAPIIHSLHPDSDNRAEWASPTRVASGGPGYGPPPPHMQPPPSGPMGPSPIAHFGSAPPPMGPPPAGYAPVMPGPYGPPPPHPSYHPIDLAKGPPPMPSMGPMGALPPMGLGVPDASRMGMEKLDSMDGMDGSMMGSMGMSMGPMGPMGSMGPMGPMMAGPPFGDASLGSLQDAHHSWGVTLGFL